MTFQSSNSFKLDLSVFRSGLDPNFAVLSFRHPEKSSTKLGDNTYATFIIHNYTNDIWDNDYVYLGSITEIARTRQGETGTTYPPQMEFSTTIGNKDYQEYPCARSAFHGYSQGTNTGGMQGNMVDWWQSMTMDSQENYSNSSYCRIYYRNNDPDANKRSDFDQTDTGQKMPDGANYNAIIKGIPINTQIFPVPYYMPDDFVLIQFDYAAPDQNIQQWDTIEVSGSEIYTVINGVYNQTTRTRGILFCARTTG